ncbi:restriction endonuclease subunit S [Pectobacterium aroidearum]|uniref:restriction endonuclease subunit S n=1 Tax=Pectobacterium aroidearum TaxID=1201031 RepID=UPI0015DD5569|nr:restriction endonuclease subunit S [Pectobacterium aroidearum]MBA0204414.1 restriction endonuclease subunit S [Pectobacterium aroidearum]
MSVDNKVPEIRFEGFHEDWNQRKLDTIFGKIRNAFVGTATPYYVKEGHFYLESNNVKDGKINRKNEIFINDEFYYKQSDKWLREGDIVMVQSGHVGHTAVIPPELNNIAAHALIMFTDPREEVSSHFLNFQFQIDKVKTKLSEITTGNTIKHILSSEMKAFEMFFSDYEEQTQIGNYFQKLDSLINQHQQKHYKLSNIKKAMLEKMFPKPGEIIPEIRFNGFSTEWEEMKLSKISDKITEKNTSGIYSETFTNSAEFGIISQRDYFDKDISNSNNIGGYYVVQPEDFVYNPRISTLAPCGPINRNTLGRAGVMSPLYTVFRTKNVNSIFIEYFFQTKLWHAFMFLNGDTGARADRFSIKDSVFFELPLVLPTVNEQVVIGNYFQKLDALISQHQQQITKLNNIKQACLTKMFI